MNEVANKITNTAVIDFATMRPQSIGAVRTVVNMIEADSELRLHDADRVEAIGRLAAHFGISI
jgi:hypothetical protein